jgi:hypothetical protein
MTVEEMLERMSSAEFMRWAEIFADKGGGKMAPEQMKQNLAIAFAARKKKKG